MKQQQVLKTVDMTGQSCIGAFPKIYSPGSNKSFICLQQYFQQNSKSIINELDQEGALFFKGFEIRSANQMTSILNKLGLKSFQYIGGAAVRKLIIGSSDRKTDSVELFTTNESPPKQPIPFHNELAQNPNYPEYLAFYCYRPADSGGSTPLVSCHQLYKYVQEKHPQFLQKLEKLNVRYIRVVGKEDNPKSPIGRGWKNVFKAQTKEQAEKKIAQNGYQFQWLDNEQHDCRLISSPIPAVRVSKSGKKVFCNQMIAVFKGWIDDKNKPLNCLKFGDFSQIQSDVMESISSYAEKIKASIQWKVGDFVLIDNEMTMHAREPFKGINRKIYASLLKGSKPVKQGLHLTLKSGDEMPIVGFGTWKLPNNVSQEIIYQTIKSGYKLLDCAGLYGNQVEIGRGIKRAINEKIITRQQLFVTSKVWNTFHRPEHVKQACKRTLNDLGLQYLDLYLIHYPIAQKYVDPKVRYPTVFQHFPKPESGSVIVLDDVPIIDTWRAMEELVAEGLVRNIGVSNFNVSLLRDLINSAKIPPAVNQVQIHPLLTQKKFIRFCQQNGVQVTSYSTMGGASYVQLSKATKQQLIVQTQTIKQLSKKYNKTCPQIIFRWAIQQGLAIIPKTSKAERLKENADVFGWALEEQDMLKIDNLNRNKRYCDPCNFFGDDQTTEVPCWD